MTMLVRRPAALQPCLLCVPLDITCAAHTYMYVQVVTLLQHSHMCSHWPILLQTMIDYLSQVMRCPAYIFWLGTEHEPDSLHTNRGIIAPALQAVQGLVDCM